MIWKRLHGISEGVFGVDLPRELLQEPGPEEEEENGGDGQDDDGQQQDPCVVPPVVGPTMDHPCRVPGRRGLQGAGDPAGA